MQALLSKVKDVFGEEKYNQFCNTWSTMSQYFSFSDIYNQEFAISLMKCTIDNKLDMDSAIVSMAYSAVKSNNVYEMEIIKLLSSEQSKMFQALLQLEKVNISSDNDSDSIKNMFIAIAKDLRVVIIRLCIEVTLLKYMAYMNDEEISHFMQDITDLYAPLSSMLGISQIKNELENATFLYYKPTLYKELTQALNKHLKERNDEIQYVIRAIKKEIEPIIPNVVVYGRQKQLYSIAKKLQSRNMTVSTILDVYGRQNSLQKIASNTSFKDANLKQIMDILAVRVLVNTVEECYMVLGKVFTMFKPLGNFKDYISNPKDNGYQSLHTAILLENGDPVEIQIRTFDMHNYAEYGLAAHWAYKERKKVNETGKKINYIRSILELYKDKSNEELKEVLQTDVYSGKIFAQTPKGKILEFTEGANPIDFAYAIHSSIGDKCVGARINGKMVPLTTPIENGDVVEIITNPNSKGPSRDWLKTAKTAAARAKIKSFFKREMKSDNIKKGRSILENSAKLKGYNLSKLMQDSYLQDVFDKYSFTSIEDMYASIGYGTITSTQILNKLNNLYREDEKVEAIRTANPTNIDTKVKGDINIKGYNELYVRLAQCCNPIPGDEIIGYVSRGNGVTVHRTNCENLREYEFERLIECSWNSTHGKQFIASLNIECDPLAKASGEITKKVSDLKYSIVSMSSTQSRDFEIIKLQLLITSTDDLEKVINKLNNMKCVHSVYRNN